MDDFLHFSQMGSNWKRTVMITIQFTKKINKEKDLHLVVCEDADPGKHCVENLSPFHCSL